MCGPYNRRGLLCGECKDGYGPAAYSFDQMCANCSSLWSRYAISLYLFLQFVPTTLIFLCFVVFRFKITSGPLLGYVLFCQITIAQINYRYSFIYDYIHYHMSLSLRVLLDMSVTVSQFWSLQFLKAIIPPFCISDKLTGIHVNMLNLVPAIYFVAVCNSTGHFQKQVFYTDPTVEWNTSIPYVLIAAVIFIFISLIPSLLLCIYPTRLYRYLSRFLSARKQLAITAFAEALHSCFKDGLNGTRDYRAMAGGTFFIALLLSALNFFPSRFLISGTSLIIEIVLWMIMAYIVSYVKPCKSAVANTVADLGGVPRVPEPPLPSAQSVRMRATHVVYA